MPNTKDAGVVRSMAAAFYGEEAVQRMEEASEKDRQRKAREARLEHAAKVLGYLLALTLVVSATVAVIVLLWRWVT